LSPWMHWLLTTHVRRDLRHYHSSGHIWQGRFKAFPTQEDEHLLTVLRYIERNPLLAGLGLAQKSLGQNDFEPRRKHGGNTDGSRSFPALAIRGQGFLSRS